MFEKIYENFQRVLALLVPLALFVGAMIMTDCRWWWCLYIPCILLTLVWYGWMWKTTVMDPYELLLVSGGVGLFLLPEAIVNFSQQGMYPPMLFLSVAWLMMTNIMETWDFRFMYECKIIPVIKAVLYFVMAGLAVAFAVAVW